MEVGVLGPLRVRDARGDVAVSGVKERTVLACLLARIGTVVTHDELVDALWPDDPPRTATKTLQAYVARLRAVLQPDQPGSAPLILTQGRGYSIAREQVDLDSDRFLRLAELGRATLLEGRHEQAAESLGAALALWRGPAYVGFEDTVMCRAEGRRLTALATTVREDWYDARLRCGQHSEVAADLEAFVTENPVRERGWSLLVRARAAAGDQAGALDALERARQALADELGVDPGDELRDLQARILAQDLTLRPAAAPLPAGIAPSSRLLAGRASAVDALLDRWAAVTPDTGLSSALVGPDGSGRWAVAGELARQVHRLGGSVVLEEGTAPPPLLRLLDRRGRADTGSECAAEPGELRLVVADDSTDPDAVRLGPLSRDEVAAVLTAYAPAADRVELDEAAGRVRATTGGTASLVRDTAIDLARSLASTRAAEHVATSSAGRARLDQGREDLAADILEWQSLAPGSELPSDECPWRGLASYAVEDSPWFAGREHLTAQLVARVATEPAVLVVGSSGSGKSSLLSAGLLASLAAGALPDSSTWLPIVLRPGAHPMRALVAASVEGAGETGPDRIADLLTRAFHGLGSASRVLLVVDQLEECWTACSDPGERHAFLDTLVDLATAPGSRTTVVAAVRADHVGDIATHHGLATLLSGRSVFVGPMVEGELRRAVEGPASRARLRLDVGLLDSLVHDTLREPGGLPLLSTALVELWEHRAEERLSLSAYAASGGVGAAVSRMAESALAQLDPDSRRAARLLLVRLAGPGEGDGVTRRRVALSELTALPDPRIAHCIDAFTEARLVTVSDGYVEVAHEALFRSWPRLRDWLDEDAAGRELRHRLTIAALEWEQDHRDPSALWAGARLSSAVDLASARPEELTALELDFVEASRARVTAERDAALAQVERARRQNRRLRLLLVGVATLLVVALVAGLLAGLARRESERQRTSATAQGLAATALTQDYLVDRMLTAVEAVNTEESPQTVGALLSTLDAGRSIVARRGTAYRLLGMDSAPGGSVGYAVSAAESIVAVDLGTGGIRVVWSEPDAHPFDPRVSPDGTLLAFTHDTWSRSSVAIEVVDTRDGRLVWTAPVEEWLDGGYDFTGDPGRLAIATPTGLQVFDVGTRAPVLRIPWRIDPQPQRLERLDDDRLLLLAGGDGAAARVIDLRTRRTRDVAGIGVAAAVSPDGRWAVSQTDDSAAVARVDLAGTSAARVELRGAESFREGVVTPDGRSVAVSTNSDLVVLVDAESGAALETLRGHAGAVLGLAVSPDGRTLWTAGRDADLIAWDLSGARGLLTSSAVEGVAFRGTASTDGSVAASWTAALGAPPIARAIDTATGRTIVGPFPGAEERRDPVTATVSPDGTRFLAAMVAPPTAATSLLVAATATGAVLGDIPVPWMVSGIAPSADGRHAVVNGVGGIARVDVERGELTAVRPLPAHPFDINHTMNAEMSPDGRWVALGRDGEVLVVDAVTLDTVASWPVPAYDDTTSFAWLEGGLLAYGGIQGTLGWRAVPSGDEVGDTRQVSPGFVLDLAAAPDGRRVAALGTDGEVTLWDAGSQTMLGAPLVPPQPGWGFVRVDPDGALVLTNESGRAFRWPTSTEQLLDRACAIAGREPTASEWVRMHGDEPQRPTCGARLGTDLLASR